MKTQAVYTSQNPSADTLTLFDGHEPIGRIHDQIFIGLLSRSQRRRWYAGEDTFVLDKAALTEHCEKWWGG